MSAIKQKMLYVCMHFGDYEIIAGDDVGERRARERYAGSGSQCREGDGDSMMMLTLYSRVLALVTCASRDGGVKKEEEEEERSIPFFSSSSSHVMMMLVNRLQSQSFFSLLLLGRLRACFAIVSHCFAREKFSLAYCISHLS